MTLFPEAGAPAPDVSVVIPTFQRREHAVRAVHSALAQTRPPEEVIVVDDGSTDGTGQALAVFGKRVRYLRQENGGASSARNVGIRAATGDVVALLDDDDCWLPDHLATVTEVFTSYREALLVSTGPGFRFGPLMFGSEPVLVWALPRLLIGNFVGYSSGTAIRRQALIEVGGYDEALVGSEGYDLWLRLARIGPFALVRRGTVTRTSLADSLAARTIADGRFLETREQIGEKLKTELAPFVPVLGRAIESYRRFVAALRAFDEGHTETASTALADACRLMPERSDEPWIIGGSLGGLTKSRTLAGRLSTFVWATEAWPDPESDTALGLRLHATFLSLRAKHVALAIRLLSRSPRIAMLRYVIRLMGSAAKGSHLPRAIKRWRILLLPGA